MVRVSLTARIDRDEKYSGSGDEYSTVPIGSASLHGLIDTRSQHMAF